MWAEALDDPEVRRKIVEALRENVKRQKTVVPALESAARINKEIGLGSDTQLGGVTIIVQGIDSKALRRNAEAARAPARGQ
jgi:hypothetical protein